MDEFARRYAKGMRVVAENPPPCDHTIGLHLGSPQYGEGDFLTDDPAMVSEKFNFCPDCGEKLL